MYLRTRSRRLLWVNCVKCYLQVGYRIVRYFPNEYLLMINWETNERVRIYTNSARVNEY